MSRPVTTWQELGGTFTWRQAMAAQHAAYASADGTLSLEAALRAWTDAKAALVWAGTGTDPDAPADPTPLAQAAAEELAYAARALAAHHDDTILYQLGLDVRELERIRAWARGTQDELDAALAALDASQVLTRLNLASGAPTAVVFAPLLAPGVQISSAP